MLERSDEVSTIRLRLYLLVVRVLEIQELFEEELLPYNFINAVVISY